MLKAVNTNARLAVIPKGVNSSIGSLRRHAMLGVAIMVALFLGLGGWSATTWVEGAVIANGVVVAEGGSRKVQHSEGGLVRQIMVRNNQHVEAGQVLLTLDDVSVRAELEVVLTQLRESLGTQSRLTAESTDDSVMYVPSVAADWPPDPQLSVVMGQQQRLRQSRKVSMENEVARISQLVEEKQSLIDGYNAQVSAYDDQLAVVRDELKQLTTLHTQELISSQRLNEMKRS